ncbi:MAG: LexA family transcriptional regulator [Deltaproteobacteria bacterium]|nr:LexA family transcriptional regulator [Deltaproteobacteria bacterium]
MRTIDPDVVLRRVGHRVAELRAARKWTQEQFAERLGVSPQYVQAVERGTENLTLKTVVRFAEELGVHPSALLFTPTTPRPRPGRPSRQVTGAFEEVEPGPGDLFKRCVPLVTLTADAGPVGDATTVEVGRWVVPRARARLAPGMFVAQVRGDSMEPSVPAGSWVLFRAPPRQIDGRIVLVQIRDAEDPDDAGAFVLKKLERRRVHGRTRLRLVSQNRRHQPIEIERLESERYRVIAELVEVLASGGAL